MDQYNLVAILFIFAATLCHGALGFMEPEDHADGQTWTASGLDRVHQLDKLILLIYSLAWICWNAYHVCFVRAQLHLKDVMTDPAELDVNGFAPAQMGEIDATSGQDVVDRSQDNSVYGRYSGRSSRIHASEIYGVIFGGSLESKGLCCPANAANTERLKRNTRTLASSPPELEHDRLGTPSGGTEKFSIYASKSPSEDLRGHLDMATQTSHVAPLEPNELYI